MIIETTDTLNRQDVEDLTEWFNQAIGTDYEINPSGSGTPDEYYVLFFDLEGSEPEILLNHLETMDFDHHTY